ncbi:MAG: hypothetical protein GXP24_14585 [Planctomycetes bacterium]|nr:hypothetical protein [Planctomycetota bacterium]
MLLSSLDGKYQVIAELRRLVAKLTPQLERQAEQIEELKLSLAKAQKDSSTSSKPPLSDGEYLQAAISVPGIAGNLG